MDGVDWMKTDIAEILTRQFLYGLDCLGKHFNAKKQYYGCQMSLGIQHLCHKLCKTLVSRILGPLKLAGMKPATCLRITLIVNKLIEVNSWSISLRR